MMWLLAGVLAFVAGFALQRGHICAVIAIRDVVHDHNWARFLAFAECAAWALAGLFVAHVLGWMTLASWPAQVSLAMAALGGALFGAGALANGACAFGSAGRLATGELSFLLIVPGFLLGALAARAAGALAMIAAPMSFAAQGPVAIVMVLLLTTFVVWRLWTAWRAAPTFARMGAQLAAPDWPPALAMAVIALANVALLLIVFAWPYTSVLVDVAFGQGMDVLARAGVVLVFLAGAWTGARTAGRFKLRAGAWRDWLQRFGGGVLMGLGAALIPGGNDALVLLGLPLLQPAAAVAYAAMVAVIGAGFIAQRVRASA